MHTQASNQSSLNQTTAASTSSVPLTTNFQVGKIATEPWKAQFQDASIRVNQGETEEAYIPVQLARHHLQRVVDDMHSMKAQHEEKLSSILQRYAAIEQTTKIHYEAFVMEVKRRALERVHIQKQQYAQLRLESENDKKEAQNRIESLEANIREQNQMQIQMLAMYQTERETLLFNQASEIQSLQRAYDKEQVRLKQEWNDKTGALKLINESLQMQMEEELTLANELQNKLTAAEMRLKKYSDKMTLELHDLEETLSVDIQVCQVLIDMCWQVVVAEIPPVIQYVDNQDKVSSVEFESHETQTIAQVLKDEANELKIALDKARTTEAMLRQQLDAACIMQANCEHQILQDVLNQLVLTIALDQNSRKEIIPSNQPLSRGMSFRSQSNALPNLNIPPEYDHLIECEVEMEKLREAVDGLKDWLAEFEAINHREPSIHDKAQVKDLYIAFKTAEEEYNAAKEKLNEMKQVYNAKLSQVEKLQSSQTMQTFPHHTLVAHLRSALDDTQRKLEIAQRKPATPVDSRQKSITPREFTPVQMEAMTALQKEVEELTLQLQVAQSTANKSNVVESSETVSTVLESIPSQGDLTDEETPIVNAIVDEVILKKDEDTTITNNTIDISPNIANEVPVHPFSMETKLEDELKQAREAERISYDNIYRLQQQIETLEAQAVAREAELAAGLVAKEMSSQSVEATEEDVDESKEDEVEDPTPRGESASVTSPAEVDEPKQVKHVMTSLPMCLSVVKQAIEDGKVAWNKGDKALCHSILLKASNTVVELSKDLPATCQDCVIQIQQTISEVKTLLPAKAAVALRKQLDTFFTVAENIALAPPRPQSKAERLKELHTEVAVESNSAGTTKLLNEYKQKLKAMESKLKADKVKITQLENALAKAESAQASGGKGSKDDEASNRLLNKKLQDAEKKAKSALDDVEKQTSKRITSLSNELQTATTTIATLESRIAELNSQVTELSSKATMLSNVQGEVEKLRTEAATAAQTTQELTVLKESFAKLEDNYKEEQALRKKYYNTIEDMKGKIRVYCRCRPMSGSELERGCQSAVRFLDEYTLELETSRGPKSFAYDQVFNPSNTQDQVFEDTKNLLQSALDGYNVCIFAYGQTGSGKTFTMTGSESNPGITPRLIQLMFKSSEALKNNNTITYEGYMLELYNDALIDLFYQLDNNSDKAPKLEIKKNDKGMVVVQNIVVKPCTSAEQTLKLFDSANKKRQSGATKMNAESSRSHSVFTILIENYNKTTKKAYNTSVGKLSLVDLAGSERAGKTGATADRLKEAQAINKSLSALGDVISALSTNEKFIPYRNNKLTQLMQDSLGGNAKTLMFVNISPADYNQEETQTSLSYASRVKLITNNANKNSDSEEVAKLKAIIKQLKAGHDIDLETIVENGDAM
ncbi:kinesin [Thraustotheca clavata]|uniref:Kinesin n=1 Tax=Thraustotheca clavata TaxID=74557 RepID=A0A1V9YU11_9STRA|nr:kinesin [Thraustotheca clavata]